MALMHSGNTSGPQ